MNVHTRRYHIWSYKRNSVNGMGTKRESVSASMSSAVSGFESNFWMKYQSVHASERITDIHIWYFAHTADQKSCGETQLRANRKNLRGIRHIVPLKLTFRPGGWAILVTWASFDAYPFRWRLFTTSISFEESSLPEALKIWMNLQGYPMVSVFRLYYHRKPSSPCFRAWKLKN